MPKPDDATMSMYVNHADLYRLARKLRSRAAWMTGDYYDDETTAAISFARKSMLEDLANDVDEAFGFDSNFDSSELDGRGMPRKDVLE